MKRHNHVRICLAAALFSFAALPSIIAEELMVTGIAHERKTPSYVGGVYHYTYMFVRYTAIDVAESDGSYWAGLGGTNITYAAGDISTYISVYLPKWGSNGNAQAEFCSRGIYWCLTPIFNDLDNAFPSGEYPVSYFPTTW